KYVEKYTEKLQSSLYIISHPLEALSRRRLSPRHAVPSSISRSDRSVSRTVLLSRPCSPHSPRYPSSHNNTPPLVSSPPFLCPVHHSYTSGSSLCTSPRHMPSRSRNAQSPCHARTPPSQS